MKYIYGASVQGIQGFIFQTNKLKEIVGASQLVDNICTTEFKKFCKSKEHDVDEDNIIMAAAGNIRYIVDEDTCRQLVLSYPKHVSNYAPGVALIQAVEKVNGDLQVAKRKLEKHLRKQKNIVAMPVDTGFMGLERARRTGGVAFDFDKDGKHRDIGTSKKVDAVTDDPIGLFRAFKTGVEIKHIPFDVEHITKNRENSWLAIVHADGNNLGAVVSRITNSKELSDFSKNLENATRASAQSAFEAVVPKEMQKEIEKKKGHYPLRPVILGGDDLTVIIRADLAFDFTKAYLRAFEEKTKAIIGTQLTASAGIAYIKQAYPFHYGAHLAEDLTKMAKKFSKKMPQQKVPSSLAFYKVQSSFTDDLDDMIKRTHVAETSGVHFYYGPYLLHEDNGHHNVGELEKGLDVLAKYKNEDSKGISKLRNWLSELHKNKSKADFLMSRMEFVNDEFYKDMNLAKEREETTTIINDLIELYTFK